MTRYGQWAYDFGQSLYGSPLFRQILARKLLLVYSHWSIVLLFLVLLGFSLTIWRREAHSIYCSLSKSGKTSLILYIILISLQFFNRIDFLHYMFEWGFYEYFMHSLRSVAIAFIPVLIIVVKQLKGNEKTSVAGTIGLLIIIHSMMTLIYLLNPIYMVQ